MGCTPSKPALESAEEPDIPAPEAGSSDDGELVAFAEESGASNKFQESVGLLARLFQVGVCSVEPRAHGAAQCQVQRSMPWPFPQPQVPMVTVTTTLGGRRLCLCAAQVGQCEACTAATAGAAESGANPSAATLTRPRPLRRV